MKKDKNVIVSTDKDAVTRSERVIEPENNAHTAGSPVISGRGLVFSAGGRNILDSLDIDVYKGERLVLLGANGCGKTTLMRTLARLNKLTSGTLEQNIVKSPDAESQTPRGSKKSALFIRIRPISSLCRHCSPRSLSERPRSGRRER